jgi:thymidine kinase
MLSITVGPMYAGKTSALMRDYAACPSDKKVIIDFNIGVLEKCFSSTMKNHDGVETECIKAKKLYDTLNIGEVYGNFQISHEFIRYDFENAPDMFEIHDRVKFSQHIFINEAQFFPDLFQFVNEFSRKHIYLYGLDGDYKREPIGDLLNLIPYSDSVIKLKAKCVCGKDAIYTHRESSEEEQYAPHANYIPNCRVCYMKKK